MMTVTSIGSLLGALATARRRSIGLHTVSISAVAFGMALTMLTFAPNIPSAFGAGFLMGLASISFMTASTAIVQLRAEPAMRGRVLALQTMVFLGSTPIGGPIVGYIADHFGARYSIAVGAVAALGAGLAGLAYATRRGAAELERAGHAPAETAATSGTPDLPETAEPLAEPEPVGAAGRGRRPKFTVVASTRPPEPRPLSATRP
jgi:MFS family permease